VADEFTLDDFKEDEFSQADFATQFPRQQFLPGAERVQQLTQERPTAIERLGEEISLPFKGGLGERALKFGVTGLKGAAVPFQIIESAITAPALAVQRGEFSPRE